MADQERPPFLPEQDYEDPNTISTYDFIYFVQDYTPFLREYLNYMHDTYLSEHEHLGYIGYYNSFIDICNEINTDHGDDGTFEQYRATLEPFMEWMTEECGHMNEYYDQHKRNANAQVDVGPTGVASRTRSKRPASGFEIPPSKRGTNVMTQGPTTQDAARIKLSDGKEYTYGELKHMWDWNKNMTPYRHPYTEDDKNKIKELIDFATKGGKKTIKKIIKKTIKKTRKNKRNARKTQKSIKTKATKVRKNKTNNKRRH
ncbi:MAG: hypothetical protein EBY20_00685 [Alphaproteobacteria bacterium]|uniref:Uncharacterized protein n=1 Tax=viral metagenome TaxID=1070528 RepID=A0A6C0HRN4_9ZZZZ|nr:hypothetical protein [Alphaproteobacteria bacterium]